MTPPGSDPLEGKVTTDTGTPIESDVLAIDAVEVIAERIAVGLSKALPGVDTYIVHRDEDARASTLIDLFSAQVAQFAAAYHAAQAAANAAAAPGGLAGIAPDGALSGFGVPVATAAVKTVIDLIALFRTDVDVKHHEFTVDKTVLVSKVASHLADNTKLYFRQLHPITSPSSAAKVLESLETLRLARDAAREAVRAVIDPEKRAAIEASVSAIASQHTAFEQALTTAVPPAAAPLIGIIEATALTEKLAAGARLLRLEVQHARGSTRSERSLWRSTLSYGGGAIVTVIVIAPDGTVELADTLTAMTGYRELPTGVLYDAATMLRHGATLAAKQLRRLAPGAPQ